MKTKVHPAIAEAESYLNPPDDGLGELARRPEGSAVAAFYAGATVFVTGAAGFVGKGLLEKLLWGCRDIRKVYVLLRPKRGKDAAERLHDMMQLPMFVRVRSDCPEQMAKVVALQGDVDLPDLGLSEEDKKVLHDETNIFFHSAASLKLEAPLYDNLRTNTAGTMHALDVAGGMTKLKAFIHLSTAFCYPDFDTLDEQVRPPPYCTPQDAVSLTKSFDRETVELISTKLQENHPNSYTFTKRLAENLVAEKFGELPVAIVRPSIVTPSWREPLPGWVDSLNGPIGVLVGGGKGVIRTMRCNAELTAEAIPLDYLVNSMLAIAYRVATDKSPVLRVYNTAAGDLRKPDTWGDVLMDGRKACDRFPFDNILWYPNGNIRTSKIAHNFWMFLTHIIPAYFIDFLMLLFGQRRFMVRIQNRISLGLELLQFFTMRRWHFEATSYVEVWKSLNAVDKLLFSFNPHTVDKERYIVQCVLGARVYTMKEPLSTLPRARRLYNVYYFVDRLFAVLFYCLLAWYAVSFFTSKSDDIGFKSSMPAMANAAEL